jgi:hypothetical protein
MLTDPGLRIELGIEGIEVGLLEGSILYDIPW